MIKQSDMVKAVNGVFLKTHKTPTMAAYKELKTDEDPSIGTIVNHYGSWNNAMADMNYAPNGVNDRWRKINFRR